MNKLKKKLSGEYRAGRRWLVYDILRSAGWLGRLRCFPDYSAAAEWCRAKSGRVGIFRIRVLADVLAGLNGVRQRQYTAAEMETLNDLVECRPISSYKESIPLTMGFLRQRYFPVLWRSMLEPLSEVQVYHIVVRRGGRSGNARVQLRGTYSGFVCSMGAVRKIVGSQRPNEELLLVGSLHGKLDLMAREPLSADGVIVFYRSVPGLPGVGGHGEQEIEMVHDPTEAVAVQTTYFARYDRPHGQINFFDEGLRRTDPGIDALQLDLAYFDFDWRDIFGDHQLMV